MFAVVGVVALLWLLLVCDGGAGILGDAELAKDAMCLERNALLAFVLFCALRFCRTPDAWARPLSRQLGVCSCYDALFEPIAPDDGGSLP